MTRLSLAGLRSWARQLKQNVIALWIAARDPRTPWQAKLVAGFVAAYALSPIDLIPDFIPVLGYLDDLLIVPLGIMLAVKMIPADLMAEFRRKAEGLAERPTSRGAAAIIIGIWLAAIAVAAMFLWVRIRAG